jgi:ribosome assembly protein YihI (activator of Der GTPase)
VNTRPPPQLPEKDDRNTHEVSADEARPQERQRERVRGGGHRGGSRGAGTSDDTAREPATGGGPTATQRRP